MPEFHWLLGYPFAVALMVIVCLGLYLVFKRRGWLQQVGTVDAVPLRRGADRPR